MGKARTIAACNASVEAEMDAKFRKSLQPLLFKMRRQFEAEDAALLAMHPEHSVSQMENTP